MESYLKWIFLFSYKRVLHLPLLVVLCPQSNAHSHRTSGNTACLSSIKFFLCCVYHCVLPISTTYYTTTPTPASPRPKKPSCMWHKK